MHVIFQDIGRKYTFYTFYVCFFQTETVIILLCFLPMKNNKIIPKEYTLKGFKSKIKLIIINSKNIFIIHHKSIDLIEFQLLFYIKKKKTALFI